MSTTRDTNKQIEYYATALKAPRIRDSATRLAEQARDASWSHEEYLAAVLSREVSSWESSGAELRIRAAGFPGRKAIETRGFVSVCRKAECRTRDVGWTVVLW